MDQSDSLISLPLIEEEPGPSGSKENQPGCTNCTTSS
jgi:hypothetical protein